MQWDRGGLPTKWRIQLTSVWAFLQVSCRTEEQRLDLWMWGWTMPNQEEYEETRLNAKQVYDRDWYHELIGAVSEFLNNEQGMIWGWAVKSLENQDQQFICCNREQRNVRRAWTERNTWAGHWVNAVTIAAVFWAVWLLMKAGEKRSCSGGITRTDNLGISVQ